MRRNYDGVMSDKCKPEGNADRRDFLKLVGGAGSSMSLLGAASAKMSADYRAQRLVSRGERRFCLIWH
jgi:hypothetical protein